MLRWKNVSFTDCKVRQFAVTCAAVFGGMALWQAFREGNPATAGMLAAVAAGLAALGLFRPRWLRPVYVAAMTATFPLGWVVSRLLLATVYFGLFTPLALFFRMIGRDALQRAPCPDRATYWQPRPAPEMSRYLRQY